MPSPPHSPSLSPPFSFLVYFNLSSLIDVWVPIINFIDSPKVCTYGSKVPTGDTRSEYSPLVAEGKRLWWYQSCMSEGCSSATQPAHGSFAPGCNPEHVCTSGTADTESKNFGTLSTLSDFETVQPLIGQSPSALRGWGPA